MTRRPPKLPALYVEGRDDVSVIAALLKRHGLDTREGKEHLWLEPLGSIDALLEAMPERIKVERVHPCGFVFDIDVELANRWRAIRDRLSFRNDPSVELRNTLPDNCPANGYFGQLKDYPAGFGVWLMPDCSSDGQMLEHLIRSLLRPEDPLWPHAVESTDRAAGLVDAYNTHLAAGGRRFERFGEHAKIKAEIRSWLAWQREPGMPFGAAINSMTLGHDSAQALTFLRWVKQLFQLTALTID